MDQDAPEVLSSEDLTAIRRQLSEGQTSARETVERLRQAHEENDMITRRRDELEARVTALEMEYEELLGAVYNPFCKYVLPSYFFFEQRKRYTRKR
jgi:kinesin family protein 5